MWHKVDIFSHCPSKYLFAITKKKTCSGSHSADFIESKKIIVYYFLCKKNVLRRTSFPMVSGHLQFRGMSMSAMQIPLIFLAFYDKLLSPWKSCDLVWGRALRSRHEYLISQYYACTLFAVLLQRFLVLRVNLKVPVWALSCFRFALHHTCKPAHCLWNWWRLQWLLRRKHQRPSKLIVCLRLECVHLWHFVNTQLEFSWVGSNQFCAFRLLGLKI